MPKRKPPHTPPRDPQPRNAAPATAAGTPPRRAALPAALSSQRLHTVAVPLLLAITAALAITSLIGDSVTFDETSHLVSGMSYLETGDFRMAADHPPLGKIWAALPLLLVHQRWPGPDEPAWQRSQFYQYGKLWLFKLNDPDRLILIARLMMVALLLATCLTVYALARTLFGPPAALLALFLATFSPTLLAHGRLVTTDMPVALAAALVLLTFARLLQRMTWPRLLAGAAALAVLSLVKFSWPIVLIGPAAMIAITLIRNAPLESTLLRHNADGTAAVQLLRSRSERAGAVVLACAFMSLTTWAAIWTCYGWRFRMIPVAASDTPAARAADDAAASHDYAEAWHVLLTEPGGPVKRARLALTDWARFHRLLPEAYLYGFSYALRSAEARDSYFMGQYSSVGRPAYFPLAFAIKTPIATMLLLAAGFLALICKPELRRRQPVLLWGLLAFVAAYAATAITSKINIGHRHLLPLYPLFCVVAGAAVTWLTLPRLRWAIPAVAAWLVGANLWIHPHYLSYFNELIGGPSNGHKYLLDSNIDWGQDLKRLARYARQHSDQPLQLAYFGSAEPAAYGIHCAALPSFWPFDAAPAELTGGLYVFSVTQLFAVSEFGARDEFWADPDTQKLYREYAAIAASPPPSQSPQALQEWRATRDEFEKARRWRLMNQLQHRPPDDRVGYSLFVYKLTQAQVDDLIRPRFGPAKPD
jgi:hypothetical protein